MDYEFQKVREHVFRMLDDARSVVEHLTVSKNKLMTEQDPLYDLQQVEVAVNKVLENFNRMNTEVENVLSARRVTREPVTITDIKVPEGY